MIPEERDVFFSPCEWLCPIERLSDIPIPKEREKLLFLVTDGISQGPYIYILDNQSRFWIPLSEDFVLLDLPVDLASINPQIVRIHA